MTNTISAALFGLIVLAVLGDITLNDHDGVLFLARKLTDLIDYLAFWR
ncbi:hypothetical protein [Rhodovulum adriaticum]|uniref:Glyceraldehyde-3-phosphate dehydrogenase n=1 Tax=Rhodovulum adriaticum TaxID=35804 RepID=A0A4V2SLF0_RHOAD|nr:hypothetical protein [Rhodovulum adriaticum]MBK1634524.1 hypothetical protein [Rhodovulum adriaticum]TCP23106.1 hypothetical protein EV656_10477 [Rhodovulum adriaticum]